MPSELAVWVEAIIWRGETAVASDWIREQCSAKVEELLAALRAETLGRAVVHVWADGVAYTEAHWSERKNRWCFSDWETLTLVLLEEWVELVDRAPLDADFGLNQAAVAWNLEGVRSYWVVRPEDVTELLEGYGEALDLHRVGTAEGEVLEAEEAQAWWFGRGD